MKIDSDSFRLKSFYDIDWRAIENLSEMNKFIHYSLNSFFIIFLRKYIMHTKSVAMKIFQATSPFDRNHKSIRSIA